MQFVIYWTDNKVCLLTIDKTVGRMLKLLKKTQILSNTLGPSIYLLVIKNNVYLPKVIF